MYKWIKYIYLLFCDRSVSGWDLGQVNVDVNVKALDYGQLYDSD